MGEYWSKAQQLDKAVEEWQKDGGTWREVRFYTKSSTNSIFTELNKLNGLANIHIYEAKTPEKHLTIEKPAWTFNAAKPKGEIDGK